MKPVFLSLLSALLFLVGVLSQLSLSSGLVWGEVEASLYGTQAGYAGLKLNCPILLSTSESGRVSATITNSLDQDVLPVVTAEISRAGAMQRLSQTLSLAPHETRLVQWPVDASDIIFGRLILVNIIQSRYSDLEPRAGSCGILVFRLFDLTGNETLGLIFIGSLAFILLGGTLWWRMRAPLDDLAEQTFKACGGLAGVTTLALFTALPRWWGLALFLDAFALIMIGVIFTEFVLFPKRGGS
jgi:hypothetical protein